MGPPLPTAGFDLVIFQEEGNNWVALVEELNARFVFAPGPGLAEQQVFVQNFAAGMQIEGNMAENLPDYFYFDPPLGPNTFYPRLAQMNDVMFQECSSILFGPAATNIYTAPEDEYLIDFLAEAGEALADALLL